MLSEICERGGSGGGGVTKLLALEQRVRVRTIVSPLRFQRLGIYSFQVATCPKYC